MKVACSLTLSLLVGAMATPAAAEALPGLFASGSSWFDFAVFGACVPYLKEGGTLLSHTEGIGREEALNKVPAIHLAGSGPFWVGIGRPGSDNCFVVKSLGSSADARRDLLDAFAKRGVKLEPMVDPGKPQPSSALRLPESQRPPVFESYCFRTDDRVMLASLLTTTHGYLSTGFQHTPLELRLSWDKAQNAAKLGRCTG